MLVRSDSWVHVGIVWEILVRGIPPQDPRFAGLPLNYVWFYNLFIALASSIRREPQPFVTIAAANVLWMAAQVALAWQLAWVVWRDRIAARAALPLLLAGLNAGALALWPLWLLRALRGEVRGLAEVKRVLASSTWDRTEVLRELSALPSLPTNTTSSRSAPRWDTAADAAGVVVGGRALFGDAREARPRVRHPRGGGCWWPRPPQPA